MEFNVDLRVGLLNLGKVGVRHDLEKEAHDTMAELGGALSFGEVALKAMDDVHLQVQKLTIDRVF